MSCCGENRATAAEGASAGPGHVGTAAVGAAPQAAAFQSRPPNIPADTVTLRSRDRGSLVVTGPVTGTSYRFPIGMSMVAVDRRDAQRLLDTGMFERVWG